MPSLESEESPVPQKTGRNGFGRAVSRILSALLRAERIICLSSRYPEPVSLSRNRSGPLRGSLFGLAPDGVFRAASLALRAVRSCRTFSPLPALIQNAGGLIFCGTVRRTPTLARRDAARVYLNRTSLSYAASRPLVFGLSSPLLPAAGGGRPRSRSDFEDGFGTGDRKERGDSPPFQNQGKYSRWGKNLKPAISARGRELRVRIDIWRFR